MRIEKLVRMALDKLGIEYGEMARDDGEEDPASIADFAVYREYRDPESTEFYLVHGEYPLAHYRQDYDVREA